jgi:hypothetical protein
MGSIGEMSRGGVSHWPGWASDSDDSLDPEEFEANLGSDDDGPDLTSLCIEEEERMAAEGLDTTTNENISTLLDCTLLRLQSINCPMLDEEEELLCTDEVNGTLEGKKREREVEKAAAGAEPEGNKRPRR